MPLSKFKYDTTSKNLQGVLDTFEEHGIDRENLANAILDVAIESNNEDLINLVTEQM